MTRSGRRPWLALLLLGLAIPLPAYLLFAPSGVEVRLARKTWRFELEIERRVEALASDWCEALPAGARVVSRRLMADPSGLRPEPAEHCRYSEITWRRVQGLVNEGEAGSTTPAWPSPTLNGLDSGQLGAERLGKRAQFFEILRQADSGETWTCRLPQAHWQALPVGLRLRLQVDRQRVANCASLPMQP